MIADKCSPFYAARAIGCINMETFIICRLQLLWRSLNADISRGNQTECHQTTKRWMVEMKGFEPSASALRTLRSPS